MTHPLYVPTIDASGKLFPSIRAAAREHGVSPFTISRHLNRHGDLTRLGMGQSRPGCQNASKPFHIGDRVFPSRLRAASELGISPSQLYRWTRKNASASMKDRLLVAIMAYDAKDRRAA